jgi:hypothetical protein
MYCNSPDRHWIGAQERGVNFEFHWLSDGAALTFDDW